MAAQSSGVEWASIVRPILAASFGSFNKNDIGELAKAIIKRLVDHLDTQLLQITTIVNLSTFWKSHPPPLCWYSLPCTVTETLEYLVGPCQ